jgi:predicted SprT family Zn-dependent metalloprotease
MTPMEQIRAKCEHVVARVKELYGMDLSKVAVSFDLRGRAAGKAGGRGYSMPASAYYVKFNRDMLTREAFDHVHNDTVPHEYAHIVCFMDPTKGKNHDYGWARVCQQLGGTGARAHREEVVHGKGATYEYTTDRGHKVRLGDKHHRKVQAGSTLRFRRGMGTVTQACAYSIVGYQGRTLEQPIVKQVATAPVVPTVTKQVPVRTLLPTPAPVVRAAVAGESKAATSRRIMLAGYGAKQSYESIIQAMIAANGYDRQLARATFKANAPKVGIPLSFGG